MVHVNLVEIVCNDYSSIYACLVEIYDKCCISSRDLTEKILITLGVDTAFDPCYARQANIRSEGFYVGFYVGFYRVLLDSIQRIILNKDNTFTYVFLAFYLIHKIKHFLIFRNNFVHVYTSKYKVSNDTLEGYNHSICKVLYGFHHEYLSSTTYLLDTLRNIT